VIDVQVERNKQIDIRGQLIKTDNSALSCDGTYLYVHSYDEGLVKIGSGLAGNLVYVFSFRFVHCSTQSICMHRFFFFFPGYLICTFVCSILQSFLLRRVLCLFIFLGAINLVGFWCGYDSFFDA